jgi:hypothetical protein
MTIAPVPRKSVEYLNRSSSANVRVGDVTVGDVTVDDVTVDDVVETARR